MGVGRRVRDDELRLTVHGIICADVIGAAIIVRGSDGVAQHDEPKAGRARRAHALHWYALVLAFGALTAQRAYSPARTRTHVCGIS